MLVRFSTPKSPKTALNTRETKRSFQPTKRSALRSRGALGVALSTAGLLVLGACSAPGSDTTTDEPTSAPSTNASGAAPSCGSDPITLEAYVETGFPVFNELAAEFTKQYPNVTFNTR